MTDESIKTEDQRLVADAKKDLRAFNALYLKYIQPVYRYALSRIGSPSEAEDATAQTFLAALEGFARYRDDGHFAAWLFSIARRKTMDHFRANRRLTELSESTPSGDKNLLQQAVEMDQLAGVMEKVRALSPGEQELLRLRYAADLSFSEIGKLMKCSADAAKKRLYRTLVRLHLQLEESDD
mgnify:CR=1 FL=1